MLIHGTPVILKVGYDCVIVVERNAEDVIHFKLNEYIVCNLILNLIGYQYILRGKRYFEGITIFIFV